jgi:hypothetical protein
VSRVVDIGEVNHEQLRVESADDPDCLAADFLITGLIVLPPEPTLRDDLAVQLFPR